MRANDIFMEDTYTAFHGTYGQFDDFDHSERGTLGAGIYFTASAEDANIYGDNVIEVQLVINNPWVVSLEYDTETSEEEDFDSQSIDAILSLPNGRKFVDAAKASDGQYGFDVMREIMSLGYDGIDATYPDGSKELVAFSQAQIKIIKTQQSRQSGQAQ